MTPAGARLVGGAARRVRVWCLALVVLGLIAVGTLRRRRRPRRLGARRRAAPSAILIGAYGNGNYGDDAIGLAIADVLRASGMTVSIVGRGGDLDRLRSAASGPVGGTRDGIAGVLSALRRTRGADVAVLGGGGLLEGDRRSVHVQRLVLEYVGKLMAARANGAIAIVHGIGVAEGLFADRLTTAAILRALSTAQVITVRDRASAVELTSRGLSPVLVRDPAAALFDQLPRACADGGAVGVVALDRHRWPSFQVGDPQTERRRSAAIDELADAVRAADPTRVELHPFHASDLPILSDLRARLVAAGCDDVTVLPYPSSSALDAFDRLVGCSTILSMRFHPALAALSAGRRVTILGSMQKLDQLQAVQGRGDAGDSSPYPEDFADPVETLRAAVAPVVASR